MSDQPTQAIAAAPTAPEPGFFTRIRTDVAHVVHQAAEFIAPDVQVVAQDAVKVVTQEIPAIEGEIVQFGLAHAPQFAADEVATLVAAIPNLAPFAPQLTTFATTLNTRFLGALALKFPAPTGGAQ